MRTCRTYYSGGVVSARRVVSTSSTLAVACKCIYILRHDFCAAPMLTIVHSSCEYREDCEWREMKAKEAQEKFVERKFR